MLTLKEFDELFKTKWKTTADVYVWCKNEVDLAVKAAYRPLWFKAYCSVLRWLNKVFSR